MKKFLLFLFIISIPTHSYSDAVESFRLDHLTLTDGLPNSSVSGILQDAYGFMWFGTQSGLTRYDGYSFETYLNDPFNDNSLPHNLVQTMYLDKKKDILWLGTYNGLSRLDINSDTFINYASVIDQKGSLSNDVVVAIERDHLGRLWIGTLDGLNLFDETTGTFTKFYNDPLDDTTLPNNVIRSILKDNNNNIWIGTYEGLSLWNEERKDFTTFTFIENDPLSISSKFVMDIIQSPYSNNVILLGTWGGGVSAFNTSTYKAENYVLSDNRVYTLLTDNQNRLWAGTWGGGLSILDLSDGSYQSFTQGSNSDLSHNIVYSLYQDLSGIVWIGTNGGGINKYVDWKNQYTFFTHNEENPQSLLPGKIQVAYEDSKKRLWFSADGSGLSRYDKETDSFINYIHNVDDKTSLSDQTINTIFEDSRQNLWIGTNNGLNKYIDDIDAFERLYVGDTEISLPDNLVYSLAEDSDKNLWIGSYTEGISILDYDTGLLNNFRYDPEDLSSLSNNLIRSIFADSTGRIWIATNEGLNLYHKETDSFIRFIHDIQDRKSISSNDVRKIFEDSDGKIWVGTNGGGVNLLNSDNFTFSHLSTEDGLLNNSIKGIEEDDNGNLLFITEAGISIYNKTEESFSAIDEKTGLLSSELASGYLKASDGSFYIGSNNGITHIPFFEEQYYSYTPMIHINKLEILGIPYEVGKTPIWEKNEIVLKYQENILSFEFVLSDYSSEGHNQFAYKMEGVDSDWVYSGERNYARYTQLDPGEYIFRVIGGDSRNNWNNIGTSLKITIMPPFWLSTAAYLFYLVFFILLILLIFFRIKRKEMETDVKIEEQKALNIELENRVRIRTAQIEESKKIAEEATKSKSLFLANMSHELRTPLNAVVGFSALLNETDYSAENRHIISSIKAAGKSLSTLINDLLDLSKLEAGKMSIKNESVNLAIVLFEIMHIFDLKVKEKNMVFHIDHDKNLPKEVMIDETRFRQILINLTGNAIKFTNSGFVKISIGKIYNPKEGFIDLQFSVEDTGSGISESEKEKIFGLFWQKETSERSKPTGTGLGLSITKNLVDLMNGEISIKSAPGEGSIFTVILHDVAIAKNNYHDSKSTNIDILENITFKGIKALIVDDIEDNRNLMIEIMKQIRIEYKYAEHGAEALKVLKNYHPDIIFMDLQMPVMDGITASRILKSDKKTEEIPIIAVTASSETEYNDDAGNKVNYFSDFITKPYSIKNITDVLKKYLSFHSYDILENENMNVIDFYNEKILDIDEMITSLEEYNEEWKELKPSGRMSILENFGLRLKELGRKHNSNGLKIYAEDLLMYISQFDLVNIERQLAMFPSIIEKLRS